MTIYTCLSVCHNKSTSGSNAGKSILASWNPADLILQVLEDKTGNVLYVSKQDRQCTVRIKTRQAMYCTYQNKTGNVLYVSKQDRQCTVRIKTRQAVYCTYQNKTGNVLYQNKTGNVRQLNIEALSCNHCCCRKQLLHILSVCL